MNPSHSNCGQECLKCVLDWYRLGSSKDDEDEVLEDSAHASPPRIRVVPDYLGSQILETEFDDGYLSLGKSSVDDDHAKSPDIQPVVDMGSRYDDPESPCTMYLNAYLKRMADKGKKTADKGNKMPEKKITRDEKEEFDSPSPSSKRFKAYTDRFIKRH